MSIEMEKRAYRLIGISPILGSQPANAAVRTKWIASKAPNDELKEEETALFREREDDGLRVFLRDTQEKDAIMIYDYVLRGYFKSAFTGLVSQLKILQPASKVDRYLFVGPRILYILRDGDRIYEEDDILERPLRAMTAQGPRNTLMSSEMVLDPWEIEFEVTLLPNTGTKLSAPITWEAVESALEYGQLMGLGGWRTGGQGRFEFERIAAVSKAAGRNGGGWCM